MSSVTKTEHPHIVLNPGIRGGRPTIVGTRIGVDLLARFMRAGDGPDEILLMYPHLTPAAIYDALSYYFDHQAEIEEQIAEDSFERVLERYGATVDETGRVVFPDARPNRE